MSLIKAFTIPFFPVVLSIWTPAPLRAQGSVPDSLQQLNDQRRMNLFDYSGNISTLPQSGQPDAGFAQANVRRTAGNFKRPMEPGSSTTYSMATGGIRSGATWRMIAAFDYRKTSDKDLGWAAVNNPYDGNPLIWADSNSGNWNRDHINALVGLAKTINQGFNAGVSLQYGIGSGARTNEPKPFYRMRNIAIQPGFTWSPSSAQQVGFGAIMGSSQEENEIGFYSNDNVSLYRLRGFGTFSRSPFVRGERKKTGNQWGGTVHYRRKGNTRDFLVSASATQREETVSEGVAQPQTTGYFTGYHLKGKAVLFQGNARHGQSFGINYENRNGNAKDVVLGAENAHTKSQTLQGRWSTWTTGKKSMLQYSVIPSFIQVEQTDRAAYLQLNSTLMGGTVELNWRYQFSGKSALQVRPFGGYFYAVQHDFSSRSENTVIASLIYPDYRYLGSGYLHAGCVIAWQFSPETSGQMHEFSWHTDFRSAEGTSFNNRSLLQLQYTMLF